MRPSASKQYTKVEVEQIEFEWTIRDFSKSTLFESDLFSGQTGDTIWSIRLKKTRGWLSATVQRVDSKPRRITGSIRLSLRNNETNELSHMHAVQFYSEDTGYAQNGDANHSDGSVLFEYNFSRVIREHFLSTDLQLLPNDQLTVVCEILAKSRPIASQRSTKSLSQCTDQDNHRNSVQNNSHMYDKDALDRSELSPDSGIFDAKDRKKRVSFNLSQFTNNLTFEYSNLIGSAQGDQVDYERGYSDEECAVNDNFEDDDVFIKEEVSRETSTLEKFDSGSEPTSSPHRSLVVETNDEFVHCKLISSDGEMDAYKSVSPRGAEEDEIFSAMITKRSDVGNGRRAIVDETEQAVMVELSRFTLSGKVHNLEQLAERLFASADKYGIDDLKVLTEDSMCKGINDDNVCARLILANRYPSSLALLKTAAIDYFKLSLDRVDKLNGYSTLLAEHPKLVADIFFSLSKNK